MREAQCLPEFSAAEQRPALLARTATHSKLQSQVSTQNLSAKQTDGVVMTVETVEEVAELHLWQQGDEQMYTLENVEKRYENRFNVDLLQLVNTTWWPTALRGAPIDGWEGDVARTWTLPQPNHELMVINLVKALMDPDETWSWDEANQLAREAWESDSKGKGTLTRTLFCDSLFELADVWTTTVEGAEYVQFLRRLFDAIGVPPSQGWKSLDDIASILGDRHPDQDERKKRRNGHRKRRAAVTIQSSSRKKGGRKHFQEKRGAATRIQAHARRKREQAAFEAKKAAAVKIQALARGNIARHDATQDKHALPNIKQPARYLLPKKRPPTRLLDRQKTARALPRMGQSRSVGALPVIKEAPQLLIPAAGRPKARDVRPPKVTYAMVPAPALPGVLRTAAQCNQAGILRAARGLLEGDITNPRELMRPLAGLGTKVSPAGSPARIDPVPAGACVYFKGKILEDVSSFRHV